ncbi:helicase C-terminal domain-containing protein [Rhodoferax antarcticus]|nr:helicase C-terminal domain-containing protein [Rhodoferax antarcticus]
MNATARNYLLPVLDVVKDHAGANMADAYRSFIRHAINQKLEPNTEIDLSVLTKSTFFLPPSLSAIVQEEADKRSLTFSETAAGLAQAGHDRINQKNTQNSNSTPSDVPFKSRPDQATFFKSIMDGMGKSKIVVAEASTGVGKGRALMAAAIQSVLDGKKPVVVAAPTVLIVNQLWGELQTLRSDGFGENINATILPGAADFVDDIKLIDWFEDEKHQVADKAVFEWVKADAPHTKDDAIYQVALEQGITLGWLVSDLMNLAENMPVQDFVLKTSSIDKTKGSQARSLLSALRQAANKKSEKNGDKPGPHTGADIIICTHAMLAIGQITKWAALAKPAALIIDEAHSFEETLSRINSHQMSLFALRYKLAKFCKSKKAKKGSVPRKTLEAASLFMKDCQSMFEEGNRQQITQNSDGHQKICNQLIEIGKLLTSIAFASDVSIQKQLASTLNLAASEMQKKQNRTSTYLEFSPDKRYPSISVGADHIGLEAGAIWKAAEGGVVMASATMYLTDSYGNSKCDYVVKNLAIPLSRLATFPPIESKHIYSIPTLHIPAKNMLEPLSRPAHKSKEKANGEEMAWMKSIGKSIAHIVTKASGGTLVLTSSYNQIQAIEALISEEHPDLIPRLIVQKRDAKFAKSIDAFKAAHREGKNPILLSLGPAWTGLDLSDNDAKASVDKLLTNLVIACCPIGLNQSPTMQRRIELTNTSAIAKEGLLIFKQGLGRLIRRDQVKDRHIWVLDGRIWSQNWLPQFTGPVKRLLKKYKKTVEFDWVL